MISRTLKVNRILRYYYMYYNYVKIFVSESSQLLFFHQEMLIYDPATRISAKKALKHEFFSNLDKKALPAAGIST